MRRLRTLLRVTSPLLGGLLVLASVAGWGRPAGTPVGQVQQVDASRAVRLLTAGEQAASSPSALASLPATTPVSRQQPGTQRLMGLAPHDSRHRVPNASDVVRSAALPGDFGAVMGYRPVLSGGRLMRADGGCSSPFGPTEFRFGDACRAHDLGYDLLRYADRKGQPLGPWARRALDDQFDHALHARCAADAPTATCHAAATVYADAVRLNSWRQGFGVPVVEGPERTLAGLGVGLVVALLLAAGTGTSARRLPHRPIRTRPGRATSGAGPVGQAAR